MSHPEFDQYIMATKPPAHKSVEGVLVSCDPDRKNYGSDLEWLCAGLKNTLFVSSGGYDLIPLTLYDLQNGFLFRLMDAWQDKQLRQGYLPTLPKEYANIYDIVSGWIIRPTGIVHRLTHSSHVDTLCYLRSDFEVLNDSELQTELVYANVHPRFQRRGHTTVGLSMLIEGLKLEIPRYGFKLKRILTEVSDNNIGSIKVLGKNGFRRDHSRVVTNSPIAMGGNSIPVSLEL